MWNSVCTHKPMRRHTEYRHTLHTGTHVDRDLQMYVPVGDHKYMQNSTEHRHRLSLPADSYIPSL